MSINMSTRKSTVSVLHRRKTAAVVIFAALLCLLPSLGVAQSTLPLKWVDAPILHVKAIAYSLDGSLVAVGGQGGVQIYVVSTGALTGFVPTAAGGFYSGVGAVAFSPDGKTLAVGGWHDSEGVVELFDVTTFSLRRTLNPVINGSADIPVSALAFSPDGKTLVFASAFGWLAKWDLKADQVQLLPATANSLNSVTFSPDGKILAVGGETVNQVTGSTAGVLELFDTSTNAVLTALDTSANISVNSVGFSKDGATVFDGGASALFGAAYGVLESWSVATGTQIGAFNTSASSVSSIALTPDGMTLVAGGSYLNDGVLELWDIKAASLSNTLKTSCYNGVFSVAISPDGLTVADGGAFQSSGLLELWALPKGSLITSIGTAKVNQFNSVAISPNGTLLACGGGDQYINPSDCVLEVRDLLTGAILSSLKTGAISVNTVAFSPDSTILASGGFTNSGGVLQLWYSYSGSLFCTLNTSFDLGVSSIAFSPNGATLAVSGYSDLTSSPFIELWSTSDGKLLKVLNVGSSNAVAFSPDGDTLAVGGGSVLELWSASSGNRIATLRTTAGGLDTVAFSPDGKTLGDGGSGVVELWSVASGSLLSSLPLLKGTGFVASVAFSSDGGAVVVGSDAGVQEFSTVSQGLQATQNLYDDNFTVPVPIAVSPGASLIAYGSGGNLVVAENPYVPVSGISVSPSSVVGGATATCTVTLSRPAPPGGNAVLLSSDGWMTALPPSVTVAGGATSANFTIDTEALTFNYSDKITATSGGISATTTLTVTSSAVSSFTISPSSVQGGGSATGTVTLWNPAPAQGVVVYLSSNSSSVTVPTGIEFQWGVSSSTFPITTTAVSGLTTATITASSGNGSLLATLAIAPATPGSVSLSPSSVLGGAGSSGTVTLTGPAGPTGAVVALTSSNSAAAVPASVRVDPNETQCTFKVSTVGVNAQTVSTITATLDGQSESATLLVTPAALISISLNPTTVIGGNNCVGTVTLSGPAAPSGTVVALSTSSNAAATVPASVTVPAGQTTGTFTISTTGVSAQATATIAATLNGQSQSASISISPASLASVSLSPATVTGGNPSTGMVILNGAAGPGGLAVSLSSNDSAATVPSSVTVSTGQSSATFTVNTVAVSKQQVATIAAKSGTVSKTGSLTITPPTPASVSLKPSAVVGGTSVAGTVTLTGPAGKAGAIVKLSSSASSATLPASVTVKAGSTNATFTVKTVAVSTQKSPTISASLNGVSQSATLTINPASLLGVSVNPTTVIGPTASTGTATLTGPAPTGGLVVGLVSNQAPASVPASVKIAAGSTHVTFLVKTVAVATQTAATLTAMLGNVSQTATLTINPPTLVSLTLSPTSVKGGKPSTGTVRIGSIAPAGGLVISLSSSDSSATVPATVTIPAGKTSATFTVKTTAVSTKTTASITATEGSTSKTATLTIS